MFELGRTFLSAVARKPQALAVIDGDRRLVVGWDNHNG